ncbi:hypothetical protein JKP88DRAFT_253060 [Tribonema minus]|uniref:Uncharacterized protein n=1 Tax=Tribonema minus TaxID=303371 RepID=A0A835Z9R6_9STRA|nr:hypothetical protein JKP88DRAFT_253060 [Tribonema minus]
MQRSAFLRLCAAAISQVITLPPPAPPLYLPAAHFHSHDCEAHTTACFGTHTAAVDRKPHCAADGVLPHDHVLKHGDDTTRSNSRLPMNLINAACQLQYSATLTRVHRQVLREEPAAPQPESGRRRRRRLRQLPPQLRPAVLHPNDASGLCGDNTCSTKGYKCRCYLKSTTGASCKTGDLIGVNPASSVDQGGGCQENRCNAITMAIGAGCCPTSPCSRRTLLAELLADKNAIEW